MLCSDMPKKDRPSTNIRIQKISFNMQAIIQHSSPALSSSSRLNKKHETFYKYDKGFK